MGVCRAQRFDRARSPAPTALSSVAGERVSIVRDNEGSLGAFANRCMHRGTELVDTASSPTTIGMLRICHSVPVSLLGVRIRRLIARVAVGGRHRPGEFSLRRYDISRVGRLRRSCGLHGRPSSGSTISARSPIVSSASRSTNSSSVARSPTTSPPTGRCSPRTTTSATTAGPVHPELCELVPSFRVRGGCGARLGARAFHTGRAPTRTRVTGTSARAPFPGLNETEQVNHFGELIYPNLMMSLSRDHVAAFILQPVAADRTMIECQLLFHPDEVAKDRLRPVRRRRLLAHGQPAGLGDLRTCAARHDQPRRSTTAGIAPMEDPSLDIRRWWSAKMGG